MNPSTISEFSVNLIKNEWATIVHNSLSVDKEIRPKVVTRTMSVTGSVLTVKFSAVDPKQLRASVSGFYEYLTLAIETVKEFS